MLAYDGDDVISWCGGRWSTLSADDAVRAYPGGNRWGPWLTLRVGRDYYALDAIACRLQRQ